MKQIIKAASKFALFWSAILAGSISVVPALLAFMAWIGGGPAISGNFMAEKMVIGIATFLFLFVCFWLYGVLSKFRRLGRPTGQGVG